MNRKKQKKNNVPTKSKQAIKVVTIVWCSVTLLSTFLLYALQYASFVILIFTLIFGVGLLITAHNECAKSSKKACLGMIANCVFATAIALAISTLVILPGTIYLSTKIMSGRALGLEFILIYTFGVPIISVIVAAAAVFKARANGKLSKSSS